MAKKQKSKFLTALEFVSVAQDDKGPAYKTHVKLFEGTLTAYDGTLTAGHLIDEQINTVAQSKTLLSAIKKCKSAMSVLVNGSTSLTIKSDKFEATIPCLELSDLPQAWPDPKVGYLDDRFLEAASIVSPLTSDTAQRVLLCSILIRSGSVAATNGVVLVEAWHGIDMPTGLVLPRMFITALEKIASKAKADKLQKAIVGFGFSKSSFTVYYEDNSWVKTQLYQDEYPDIDRVLNVEMSLQPVPQDFFEAVDTLGDFSEDGRLRMRIGRLQTHMHQEQGAKYEVPGLIGERVAKHKDLKFLSKLVEYFDFRSSENSTYFTGKNVRGAMSNFREVVPESEQPNCDDIPFD